MAEHIAHVNAALCMLLALVACWAILHPRVDDGIIIKAGLISAVLGFYGIAPLLWDRLWRNDQALLGQMLLLVLLGLVLVVLGLLLRSAPCEAWLVRWRDELRARIERLRGRP